ncbi:hypothetical protein [Methylobacterium oryzihabitans]|uniref:Uncharacterized protein n=1 Tax=Methylobacterium oryzihabitans TaxID=2499852 RepID=A0A437NZD4_9HYPH|nr:hypothetical protein [Methylobacterium oryzihabitans]RVU15354.1 hypothetical protein EOE48_20190 [Methylobacterium oryzihabitans]
MLARSLAPALVLALTPLVLAGPARAQSPNRVVLDGTCERLVLGGRETAGCRNELVNTVQGRRTSFDFTAGDGTGVSFSGTGAPQEKQEEFGVDALQPVSVVVLASRSPSGDVLRETLVAVGSCRFPAAAPGTSTVACAADTQRGRFEATFTSRTGAGVKP